MSCFNIRTQAFWAASLATLFSSPIAARSDMVKIFDNQVAVETVYLLDISNSYNDGDPFPMKARPLFEDWKNIYAAPDDKPAQLAERFETALKAEIQFVLAVMAVFDSYCVEIIAQVNKEGKEIDKNTDSFAHLPNHVQKRINSLFAKYGVQKGVLSPDLKAGLIDLRYWLFTE